MIILAWTSQEITEHAGLSIEAHRRRKSASCQTILHQKVYNVEICLFPKNFFGANLRLCLVINLLYTSVVMVDMKKTRNLYKKYHAKTISGVKS